MMRVWGGLLLAALLVFALPVQADEVQDLKRLVQELKAEVDALKAERSAGSVEKVVDEYLASRASEGGDLAGHMDGKFTLKSAEGDFQLNIGGGVVFDGMFYEPESMANNRFAVNLVRVAFSGQVGDGFGFKVQPEFSTSGATLKDAYIQLKTGGMCGSCGNDYIDGISWTFGQFKMPFSLNELTSVYAMDTIMRPTIVRALAPGRDIGAMISNSVFDDMLEYAIAISNGMKSTDEFWYWAHIGVSPFAKMEDNPVKGMKIGLHFGTTHTKSGTSAGFSTAGGGPYGFPGDSADGTTYDVFAPGYEIRGREILVGFDVVVPVGPFCFKGEAIYARQELDDRVYRGEDIQGSTLTTGEIANRMGVPLSAWDLDDELVTYGAYCALSFFITGEDWTETPSSGLEVVLQGEYGVIDAGGDADEHDFYAGTLGLNYYFNKYARVMLNYVVTDFGDDTIRPTEEDGVIRSGGLDHSILLRVQLTF